MPRIQAAQLIHTNMELGASGHRGKKNFRYTHGLIDGSSLERFKKRCCYPGAMGARRRLFYRMSPEYSAIVQVIGVTEPDTWPRGGYVAHGLVLSSQDLSTCGNNPFFLLDHFNFAASTADFLGQGDPETGHLGWTNFEIPANCGDLDSHLELSANESLPPPDTLGRLLKLASGCFEVDRPGGALALYGTEGRAYRLLKTLFTILPRDLRPYCAFDTRFTESTPRTLYWALGCPAGHSYPQNVHLLDLAQCSFAQPVSVKPNSAYDRWAELVCETAGVAALRELQQFREEAWILSRRLDSSQMLDERWLRGVTSDEFLRRFVAANRTVIAAREADQVRELVRGLGETALLQGLALGQPGQEARCLLSRLCGRPSWAVLLPELLQHIYRNVPHRLTQNQRSELNTILDRYQRDTPEAGLVQTVRELSLILSCSERSWIGLRERLGELKPDEFIRFARWALRTIQMRNQPGYLHDDAALVFGTRVTALNATKGDALELLSALIGLPPPPSPLFPRGRIIGEDAIGARPAPMNLNQQQRWYFVQQVLGELGTEGWQAAGSSGAASVS